MLSSYAVVYITIYISSQDYSRIIVIIILVEQVDNFLRLFQVILGEGYL